MRFYLFAQVPHFRASHCAVQTRLVGRGFDDLLGCVAISIRSLQNMGIARATAIDCNRLLVKRTRSRSVKELRIEKRVLSLCVQLA